MVNIISAADANPPAFSLNMTNATFAGTDVLHSIYWQDDVALSGYIFSFDNGTGTFANDSFIEFSGTGWSNVTKSINFTAGATIGWRVFANDTSNNVGASEIYIYNATIAKQFNITIYNSSSLQDNNVTISVLSADESLTVASGSGNVTTFLNLGQNYTLSIAKSLPENNLTAKIVNLNVTGDLNITSQIINSYIGLQPDSFSVATTVFAFNDSGLSYEYATVYIPNGGKNINRILHCTDWNFTSGNCTDSANWTVNATSDYAMQQNSTHFWFNTSEFDGYGGGSVYLEVALVAPDPLVLTNVIQNQTFTVNATVYCRGGDCGNVSGTLRYNHTSVNPDTPMNTTQGDQPFYINETPAYSTKNCATTPLLQDQFCNITWVVNATDPTLSSWKIGVNFSSNDTSISSNYTDNATVSVVPCIADVTLSWHSVTFPEPTIPSPIPYGAIGNADYQYNITVNQGSCNTDLYIKGADFENQTFGYSFGIGNLTWSNTSNSYDTSYNMTASYEPLMLNVPEITNVTTWYWLNVPPVFAANYNSTVYIGWVKNGEPSP